MDDACGGRFGSTSSSNSSKTCSSSKKQPHPKSHGVLLPRVGHPGGHHETALPTKRAGIKPHSDIIRDAPERETWNGTQLPRGRDGDAEKEKLANAMASRRGVARTEGDWLEELRIAQIAREQESVRQKKQNERKRMQNATPDVLYREVTKEIDERWEFLEQMRAVGKGETHRVRVEGEIGERVRQLKRLDEMIRAEEAVGV
jgi:hypothetical protein|tara:strand:- start:7012 stop:7617 length:606 start_codon:yes stop_codon:yes gene_type:complete|mmetsp:Transcript_169/g.584  ORF Transcript_169/g.584 Transcript_169/m.584 type:complete len:202 (-) Transcript_169:111-716(-)|eukprot:CAMPEP_0117638820 /NCGR_PEP_ID=MMETSP0802-20121206/8018_1 /TAXON_ID=38833 /ORGANISM="Micromonas sp., Strain CCMP2099" /LENGTH=201 /DNA_ID=CAMNT_0005443753 /DNA_START=227 /DNA_END=832 /DNA_ORIENTATION=+